MSGRELVSKVVETPPPAPRVSPWDVPSDRQIAEVAQLARSAKGRIAQWKLEGGSAPILSKRELRAVELWDCDHEWFFKAKEAGVPRRYWRADLDACEPTAAVAAVREFLNGLGDDRDEEDYVEELGCLVLCGAPGTGKTFAGVGGLRSVRNQDLAFFDVRVLSRELMDPARREETLNRVLEVQTLLLDDLGAAYIKQDGFLESLLEEIFIVREANPVETIVTTNLTRAQLESVMGHRVADRLAGRWASVVELRGAKSLRRARP